MECRFLDRRTSVHPQVFERVRYATDVGEIVVTLNTDRLRRLARVPVSLTRRSCDRRLVVRLRYNRNGLFLTMDFQTVDMMQGVYRLDLFPLNGQRLEDMSFELEVLQQKRCGATSLRDFDYQSVAKVGLAVFPKHNI